MADFGAGLGGLIGGMLGHEDLSKGLDSVNGVASGFGQASAPYNSFGQSFLSPAGGAVGQIAGTAGTVKSYDDFMKDYTTSPAAKYQLGQAKEAQNESAASTGQLLSGQNERALSTISEGVSNQFANQAYDQYLKGNSQQFGQLETALGNMFQAIGVGTTATGQQAGVATGQMGATSQIAQAQAKTDQSKGSGLGSIFGGLGSLAAAF